MKTTRELAEQVGCSVSKIKKLATQLYDAGFAEKLSTGHWVFFDGAAQYIWNIIMPPGSGRPKGGGKVKCCCIKIVSKKNETFMRLMSGRKGTGSEIFSVKFWPGQLESSIQARKACIDRAKREGYHRLSYIDGFGETINIT